MSAGFRQGSLAHPVAFDDGEDAGDGEIRLLERGEWEVRGLFRRGRVEAEVDDARRHGFPRLPEEEPPVVAVEGENGTVLSSGASEDLLVGAAGPILDDGRDGVSRYSQAALGVEREILIGKAIHEGRVLPAKGEAALSTRGLGGVGEDGPQIRPRQVGVIVQDLLLRPARREQPEQELRREPRSRDHGLTGEYLRVRVYELPPFQVGVILPTVRVSP